MAIWRNDQEKQALFAEVALAHIPGLYYAALRLSGNSTDAEDLVQETYTRGYHAFGQFTLGTNARAWLYRIMHNTFLNEQKRAGVARTRVFSALAPATWDTVAASGADPAQVLEEQTLDTRLSAALATLAGEDRRTLVTVVVGGFSYAEAAAILGCPVGTVRSRLHRARTVLRARLTEASADQTTAAEAPHA